MASSKSGSRERRPHGEFFQLRLPGNASRASEEAPPVLGCKAEGAQQWQDAALLAQALSGSRGRRSTDGPLLLPSRRAAEEPVWQLGEDRQDRTERRAEGPDSGQAPCPVRLWLSTLPCYPEPSKGLLDSSRRSARPRTVVPGCMQDIAQRPGESLGLPTERRGWTGQSVLIRSCQQATSFQLALMTARYSSPHTSIRFSLGSEDRAELLTYQPASM